MKQRLSLSPRSLRICVLVALVALLVAPAKSAARGPLDMGQDRQPIPQGRGPTDPQELEGFLDAFWGEQMKALRIPGAVVVWVQDGQVLLAKGYGYADLEQRRPVLPGETLFAVGSVAKVFTATAVMQLAERGLLDLHRSVNDYLRGFRVGDSCSKPVTTAQLLTHSAGFDERLTGVFPRALEDLVPLKEYLAARLPPCVRPPGEEMSYCNHCYGLAGYLVEELSGLPFNEYVEHEIFEPLGMEHSSFRQPLPPALAGLRANGYIFTPKIQAARVPHSPIYPSAWLYSTGSDMARYMIAQLEGASGRDTAILKAGTVQEMQQRQFAQHPGLEGWTYGFFEHLAHGQRAVEKGGDITGFSSLLFLLPEQRSGLFLAFNATVGVSQGFADPRELLVERLLERYFPTTSGPVDAHPTEEAKRLVGQYRMNRYAHTTIDKALAPLSILQWRVMVHDDGVLTLTSPALMGGARSEWVEVEPLWFRNSEGEGYLGVRQDENGRISHLLVTVGEEGVLERVPWYDTDNVQLILIIFLLLIFLSTLGWPAAWLIRTLRGRARQLTRLAPWAGGLALLMSVLNVAFLAGLAAGIVDSLKSMAPEIPGYFRPLLVLPLVTTALAVVALAVAVLSWRRRSGSLASRWHLSLVTAAGLLFVWFANHWNLLGFRF